MRVALEIEHRVDDVLEHARAGDRALLGDVPDQDHGDAGLLGEARQLRRALAHLRDAAGCRFERLGVHRLDRVDDHDLGRAHADRADDRLELHFGKKLDRRVDQAEPAGAQRDLLDGFLAGDVERAPRRSDARPSPAAAASTCRCRDRRRAAPHRRRPGRRPARGRTPRCRSPIAGCAPFRRSTAAEPRSRHPPAPGSASPALRRPSRPACSRRRIADTVPATCWLVHRIRCRRTRCLLSPRRARQPSSSGMHDRCAELADDDAGGLVGDAHRTREVGVCGQQRPERRDHRVARHRRRRRPRVPAPGCAARLHRCRATCLPPSA